MPCLQENGLITRYTVRYNESTVMSGPFETSTMTFTARSLYPGTLYTIEVAANSTRGRGPYQQLVLHTQSPTGKYSHHIM